MPFGSPRRPHPRPPVPPAALNGASGEQWTNLGYWATSRAEAATSGSPSYGLAARELARRVGRAAALGPDDVVIDVACGYGDSLQLWIEEFGLRRVVGVEPDPTLCALVEARVRDWGLSDRIRVHCTSAEHTAPRELDAQVTAVVSVDAAYHFRARADWLRSVAASLPPGGRVAFSDLLWTSERPLGALATFVARSMRIHAQNLLSESALQTEIRRCGLELLASEHCGEAVLDGFARHAPRGTLAVAFTRALIKQLRSRGSLDYAVTAAIQPIAPRSAIRG